MADLTCNIPSKRARKRLFDLDVEDLFDVDALFDESGSEYKPDSDIDNDLEVNNIIVSIATFRFF